MIATVKIYNFKRNKYDICVIGGAGRVGLPLSIAFAEKGKKVVMLDSNKNALATINSGIMTFLEEGCEEKLGGGNFC